MHKLQPRIDPNLYRLSSEQMTGGENINKQISVSLLEIRQEFNNLEHINTENRDHLKALRDLFPLYLLKECTNADWKLLESMSRYDKASKTFVVGCFKSQPFELISYKWRFKSGVKWRTRAGTSPNSTLFIRIFTDNEPIYVIEGHRDSLAAVLLGIDFIMIPYAGFKLQYPLELQNEVADRDIVFIVEDESAYNCMVKVAEYLKITAKSIHLIELNKTIKKMDLSDYIKKFNNKQELINGLQNRK